ncbi:MAG TPA: penicillin-binding protein 2 [Patescibacteria group bacterium]|nr:penicillin-binding protein 2 [Patescibacteria group bacterium]
MTKTGVAFPDFIILDKSNKKHKDYEQKNRSTRSLFLIVSAFIVFLILFARLFYLQIIDGSYYRYLSDNNRTKTVVVHAPRGIIFDRNNTPLVFNVPGFRKTSQDKTTLLTKDEAMPLLVKGEKDLEVDSLREYPYKDILSHVLGYVGQISKEEMNNPVFIDYNGGDLIGKMGIEREYESTLKGVDEKQLIEVDSSGKTVRKLGETDPIPGKDIKITIDLKLQKAAYEATKDIKRGVVIASTPDGEILAMISRPSFDPNLFTMGEGYKDVKDSSYKNLSEILLDSSNNPLLDRAISGVYPPGSTFKLVVAAGGLEDKVIDKNWEVEDVGILRVGAFSFGNWYFSSYGRKEGSVNVVKGIKRSNDIFFYKLAEKLGVENISKWAEKFGLGKPLGIDLEGELSGTIPSPEWKEKQVGEGWYLGDTYHYGIGQGYLLTTPIQVNGFTQAIANKGILYKPYLLLSQKPKKIQDKFLSESTISLLRQGMIESCQTGGVAWPLFDFKVKNPNLKIDGKNILEAPQTTTSANFKDYRKVTVACKTGTAQHGGEETLPHAWITLFAPAYDPQVVITVLVEESGEGSNIAAPIAKKVLESYFSKD